MAGLLTLEGRACAWYTDTRREGPRMYFEDFMSKFTELPIACYVSCRTGEDMASGRWYKRHLHREFEVLYLESGDGVITLNREPLPIHTGEVILIPPFVPHEARADRATPLREHCICFDLSLLHNADPAFARSDVDVTPLRGVLKKEDPITAQVADHLLKIIRACQEHPAGWTLITRGHLMLMFSLLAPRLEGLSAASAPLARIFAAGYRPALPGAMPAILPPAMLPPSCAIRKVISAAALSATLACALVNISMRTA